MGKDSEFYRIKMTYQGEKEDGGLDTIKSEDLVMAVNYTDAEKIAFKLMEDKAIDDMESVKYEIIKTKITDVIYNNTFVTDVNLIGGLFIYYFEEGESTEVGLYSVQVIYIELKENGKENGKEKRSISQQQLHKKLLLSSTHILKMWAKLATGLSATSSSIRLRLFLSRKKSIKRT